MLILGGTDEEGTVDPYIITFIFNSGMNHSLKGKDVLELDADKNDKEVSSYSELHTCGDGS